MNVKPGRSRWRSNKYKQSMIGKVKFLAKNILVFVRVAITVA